jgi:hypothetical protein
MGAAVRNRAPRNSHVHGVSLSRFELPRFPMFYFIYPFRDKAAIRLHVRTCTVLLLVIIGMMVTVSGWYMLSKLPLALNRDGIAIDGGSLQGAVHGTGGPYSFPH